MLYNEQGFFESEKERNLYYKIFAGFLFNPFVDGSIDRLQAFYDKLGDPSRTFGTWPQLEKSLAGKVHISFDNHSYMVPAAHTDLGEFADILIHDIGNRVLTAVEAKFLSEWKPENDIEKPLVRLQALQRMVPESHVLYVLLLPKRQWCEASGKRFQKSVSKCRIDIPVTVLFWEDLLDDAICPEPEVARYLQTALSFCDTQWSYHPERGDWKRFREPARGKTQHKPTRDKDDVGNLVAWVLKRVGRPYPEDLIDQAFRIIERNSEFRQAYDEILSEHGTHSAH